MNDNAYRFFDPMKSEAKIHGLVPGEYCRVPSRVRERMNDGLKGLSYHTSGGRIRFTTDSDSLSVRMAVTQRIGMAHMPLSGSAGLDIFADCGDGLKYAATKQPAFGRTRLEAEVPLPKGEKNVTIYLPLYNGVKSLKIGTEKGASLGAPPPYTHEKPVVFYGSSITQGGCASRTSNSYCALLARRLDSDFINLGFSGSAKGEAYMADYIAGLAMSCFVYDYDHNAPNVDHLVATHQSFFRTIRERRPDLPVVLVTRPDVDLAPQESERRRAVVRQTYDEACAAGDRRVYFVDGFTLFGRSDRDACTVDGCHPNDLGFVRMADGIEPALRAALGAS